MATVEQTLVLINKVGLHARPAAQFVQTAAGYSASVMIEYAGQTADAKRILQVLQLGAEKGAELHVRAEGADAREAVAALPVLVAERFGEPGERTWGGTPAGQAAAPPRESRTPMDSSTHGSPGRPDAPSGTAGA